MALTENLLQERTWVVWSDNRPDVHNDYTEAAENDIGLVFRGRLQSELQEGGDE